MKKIKDFQRGLCGDICDIAGRDNDYLRVWIYAILLDIAIPILLFISGLTTAIIGLFLGMLISLVQTLIIVGIIGIIVIVIIIGAVVILYLLEFREIGLFIAIPLGASGLTFLLFVIPLSFLSILGILMSLIPWHIIAVVVHIFLYQFKGKK